LSILLICFIITFGSEGDEALLKGGINFIQLTLSIGSVAENKIEFMAGIITTIPTVHNVFFFHTLSYFTDLAVKLLECSRWALHNLGETRRSIFTFADFSVVIFLAFIIALSDGSSCAGG